MLPHEGKTQSSGQNVFVYLIRSIGKLKYRNIVACRNDLQYGHTKNMQSIPAWLKGLLWPLAPLFISGHGVNLPRSPEPAPPNIIFLLTDDQRWDAMGIMGNPTIRTPHMDRLASAGILFEHAYVTTSICCVSRASLLTGQYASRHGIRDFVTDLDTPALAHTYPALLRQHGYITGFIGKFGVGRHFPGQLFDYFVDTEAGGKGQPDYLIKDRAGHDVHDTDSIDHAMQLFLDRYGTGPRPFCLSVSFKAPHELDGHPPSYIVQDRFKSYYQEDTIPLPVTAAPAYWQQMPDFFRTDTNFARARWKGLFGTPALYQENVKNYYRLVSGVDEVLGHLMDRLRTLGIARNTVIIFMGDNGFFLGEHGLEGKWYGYEESIRVPLFIYSPRLSDRVRQMRTPKMALNIDIAPTILSLAGVEAPDRMQGVDLIALAEGRVPERKAFFYQYLYLGSPRLPQVEGVVTPTWKYMNYIEHGYEELFDTRHDPHETQNLAKDPRYSNRMAIMRRQYAELKRKSY